jgi:hypothetical protein
MNNGQSTQIPDSPEMFTAGVGTKNTEDNSFEADKNLNLDNWAPERNLGAIGEKTISSNNLQPNEINPLPLPSSENYSLPSEAYNPTAESLTSASVVNPPTPELGQIVPMEPVVTEGDSPKTDPTSVSDDSPAVYTWKKAMTGERLSNNYIKKFDESIKKLDTSGDIAAFVDFWAEAGENFRNRNTEASALNRGTAS